MGRHSSTAPRREFYRRRLPHWQPEGAVFFVTFRLFGSLPEAVVQQLAEERRSLMLEPARPEESPRDRALRHGRRLFELADAALDRACSDPTETAWLGRPEVATLVLSSLRFWDGVRYQLHRYTLLPNHAHVLLEPLPREGSGPLDRECWPLAVILQGLKGYTAREANRLLGRSGLFWQDESWDRWVRDADEYARIVAYIDHNPVAAGLCRTPEEWPWSSAGEEYQARGGR